MISPRACITHETKEKARVLFVTNYCAPYRTPLFERLSTIYDIEFVFWRNGRERGWDKFGDFHYTDLRDSKIRFLSRLLKNDYDLVISNFLYNRDIQPFLVFLISKLLRKPVIVWIEEWYWPRTLARKLFRPLIKAMLLNYNAYIVPGSRAEMYVLSFGASKNPIFIAPNASRVRIKSKGTVERLENKFNIGSKKVILFLGRLLKWKGAHVLIKAFSKLEKEGYNAVLLIGGRSQDLKEELESLCKELGTKKIKFIGRVNEDEKASLFLLCDCFVLPSIETPSYCEAWGLVLNEAMSCGKPVIATDAVGAAPDLIYDGVNGFIVRNADVSSLYESIRKIISDQKLASRMGLESRRIINNRFTYKHMTKGFSKAIEFVLR